MSDENFITFGNVCGAVLAITIYLIVMSIIIIFIPLGLMYIWWNWICKPKTSTEVMSAFLFGIGIESPILILQIEYIYPAIWAMI